MIVATIRRSLVVAVLAMLLSASLAQAVETATGDIAMTDVQLAALGIRLEAPQLAAEAGTLRFAAKVMVPPTAERAVVAPLAGTVEQLLVTAGDTVRTGQPLATLFSADLGALKSGLVQLQAAERLARADRDRDTALHADGIIAARRLQETQGRHEVAATQLAEARQRLRLAGVGDADLAGKGSDSVAAALTLRAPQDGVVLAQSANVGERVEAGALLFRVARLDRLWLDVQVPVEAAASLKIGDRLRLGSQQIGARIRSVGRDAGAGTQSVQVRAEIDAGSDGLRPGQAVEVELRTAAAAGWAVVDAAIVRDRSGSFVFVRSASGFRAVTVKVLGRSGNSSIVDGALSASDRLAVSGVIAIKGAWVGHGGGE